VFIVELDEFASLLNHRHQLVEMVALQLVEDAVYVPTLIIVRPLQLVVMVTISSVIKCVVPMVIGIRATASCIALRASPTLTWALTEPVPAAQISLQRPHRLLLLMVRSIILSDVFISINGNPRQ
jgi:hypothetical protein